jgi:hypothetical protein
LPAYPLKAAPAPAKAKAKAKVQAQATVTAAEQMEPPDDTDWWSKQLGKPLEAA